MQDLILRDLLDRAAARVAASADKNPGQQFRAWRAAGYLLEEPDPMCSATTYPELAAAFFDGANVVPTPPIGQGMLRKSPEPVKMSTDERLAALRQRMDAQPKPALAVPEQAIASYQDESAAYERRRQGRLAAPITHTHIKVGMSLEELQDLHGWSEGLVLTTCGMLILPEHTTPTDARKATRGVAEESLRSGKYPANICRDCLFPPTGYSLQY